MKKNLKLPEGAEIKTKICLVNQAGVTVREFDTQEELEEYLESIQQHIATVKIQTIIKTRL